jgi:FkbM family methyltransferase
MMLLVNKLIPVCKVLIYGLVECLTLNKGVRRTINSDIVVFPVRYSRYYPDGYEIAKQAFINKHCSGISLDLGAHIGLYTVVMARKCDRVLAFEPTLDTRKALEKVVKLNKIDNVEIRSEAVAQISGSRYLKTRNDKISNANGFYIEGLGKEVQVISVDDLGLEIDFIKMDIEGAELEVLKGATNVLRNIKAMTIEIHPRLITLQSSSTEEIWDILARAEGTIFIDSKIMSKEDFVSRSDGFEIQVLFSKNRS